MIGSLCSGYGGLDLAVGLPVSWHCENDPYASKILDHHHPGVPNHNDIRTTDWTKVGPVEWVTAGFPCQPWSQAGLRQGESDARHIWPSIAGAISVLRPSYVFLENVRGLLSSSGILSVLGDFAEMGRYVVRWGVVRACDAGAPHQRERVFILAASDPHGLGWHGTWSEHKAGRFELADRGLIAADTDSLESELLGAAGQMGDAQAGEPGEGHQRQWSGDATGDCGALSADADSLGSQGRRESARSDAQRTNENTWGQSPIGLGADYWGQYWPAVERWESVVGRPAPLATQPSHRGDGNRLSAVFTEWMMGLPEGHVTDVPGLAWTRQIKALGNGVVPQQARLALDLLMEM